MTLAKSLRFRGYSSELDRWVYGQLFIEYGPQPYPIRTEKSPVRKDDRYFITFPSFADWGMPRTTEKVQVNSESIGVSTGIFDATSKEVFEDDFLRLTFDDGSSKIEHVCYGDYYDGEYLTECKTWMVGNECLSDHAYASYAHKSYVIEIIGNAFNTPELFEELNYDSINRSKESIIKSKKLKME
jgi:hypothetical protein